MRNLGDRLYNYCINNLATELGVAVFELRDGELITTHFNQVAANIWEVPAPRNEIVNGSIIGNSIGILFPKSFQSSEDKNKFIELTAKPIHVGVEIAKFTASELALDEVVKIGAWDDSEPSVHLSMGAFTDEYDTVLVAIAAPSEDSRATRIGDFIWDVSDPRKWAKFRHRLEAQRIEAGKLGASLKSWAIAIGSLALTIFGLLTAIPGVKNFIPDFSVAPPEGQVDPREEKLHEQLEKAYNEIPQFLDNPSNGVYLWQYWYGCKTRKYVAGFSENLKSTALDGISVRYTSEVGWEKILEAHKLGQPAFVRRSELPKTNALFRAMNSLGVKEVVAVPVNSTPTQCPHAYISSGYLQELSPERRETIATAMKAIAPRFETW